MSEQPDWRAAAVARIEAADISANIYRTARRLLDLAGDDGNLKIKRSSMMRIAKTTADGTMRRHLGTLTSNGIIHYSTNEFVYISFVNAPVDSASVITTRAQDALRRADDEPEEPQSADPVITTRAQDALRRADDAPMITRCAQDASTRAQDALRRAEEPHNVCLFVNTPTTNGDQEQTNKQTTDARGIFLLTDDDVGLTVEVAQHYASLYEFDQLLRHVGAWWQDRQAGSIAAPGALIHRLRSGWNAGPLSEEFRQSSIGRRHVNAQELAAVERQSAYRPSEYADIILG